MTIREMEEKTGIPRANIRYYEAQGLLHPARQENGYRSYSESDALTLERIRLLRSLGLSIEEILSLQKGQLTLPLALEQRLETMTQEQEALAKARATAQAMLEAGTEYDALDPALWRADLEPAAEPPRLELPWRRYLARELDFSICAALVSFLPMLGTQLEALVSLIALLLLEPVCLNRFGTTPGKAIFAIRVAARDSGRLTYAEALERTWLVLWEGMLLRIPFLCWYALGKSLLKNQDGEPLPWELDSEVIIGDDKRWRYALYIPAALAALAAMVLGTLWTGGI